MRTPNQMLSKLPLGKRELVARLLKKKTKSRQQKVRLEAIEGDVFPVSFTQKNFLEYSHLNTSTGNLVIPYELEGEIELAIFEESYNELINRHKALRVSFFKKDGVYFQRLRDKVRNRIIYYDLRNKKKDPYRQLLEFVEQEINYQYALETEVLFRVVLLRLAEDKYFLINNIHHLITDAWSNLILASEFMNIYNSICKNKVNSLKPPIFHNTDHACWEKKWLQSEEAEEQKEFWKNYLAGALPVSVKTDFPRNDSIEYSLLLNEELMIDSEIVAKFIEFCAASNVSTYTGVLAVFFILLHHYSGAEDICIGAYTALRNKIETFFIVGYLVNDITFRARVKAECTFRTFLKEVQKTTTEAQSRIDIPKEIVNNLLDSKDENPLSSLHRVIFLCSQVEETLNSSMKNHGFSDIPLQESSPLEHEDLPWKATMVTIPGGEEYTDRDLICSLYINEKKLKLRLWYNSSLFEKTSVEKILKQFEKLFCLFSTNDLRTIEQALKEV